MAGLRKLRAGAAGDGGIFDQLHRRFRIAHAVAALRRLDDGLAPIAVVRRATWQRRVDIGGCLIEIVAGSRRT
jgi:precorrin-4 methylase